MRFVAQDLPDVVLVQQDRHADGRGFFARSFCAVEFARYGLPGLVAQCNVSFNARAGTLRGLHWQAAPHEEGKLIRCTAGAVFDVAVDIRPDSLTRGRWVAVELAAATGDALWVPPGFAHGFQSLADGTELLYQMTVAYVPGADAGVRWDSPSLSIAWPLPDPIVSARDAALPLFA